MTRTLYIDVDGVICPFGPEGASGWGTGWKNSTAGLLPVAYAPDLVDALNRIAATPRPAASRPAGHAGRTLAQPWWKTSARSCSASCGC